MSGMSSCREAAFTFRRSSMWRRLRPSRAIRFPSRAPPSPGAIPFHQQTLAGLHYHMNLLTPYWNPEAGMALDTTYAEGLPLLGEHRSLQEFYAQMSFVKTFQNLLGLSEDTPFLRWLGDTRLAARVYAAEALARRGTGLHARRRRAFPGLRSEPATGKHGLAGKCRMAHPAGQAGRLGFAGPRGWVAERLWSPLL